MSKNNSIFISPTEKNPLRLEDKRPNDSRQMMIAEGYGAGPATFNNGQQEMKKSIY